MNTHIFKLIREKGAGHAKALSLTNVYMILEEAIKENETIELFITAKDFVKNYPTAPNERIFRRLLNELEELGFIEKNDVAGKGIKIKPTGGK